MLASPPGNEGSTHLRLHAHPVGNRIENTLEHTRIILQYNSATSTKAYCVYMIHPAVLIPLEYAFERLLMLITGVYIARRSTWDHTHSSVALGGSDSGVKFIFTGWLLVGLATQLVVWPLAMVVRRLPQLRRVL